MDQGCLIAMEEAKRALELYRKLERVVFTPFGDAAVTVYQETFARMFS